jgi:hypothetical protein
MRSRLGISSVINNEMVCLMQLPKDKSPDFRILLAESILEFDTFPHSKNHQNRGLFTKWAIKACANVRFIEVVFCLAL